MFFLYLFLFLSISCRSRNNMHVARAFACPVSDAARECILSGRLGAFHGMEWQNFRIHSLPQQFCLILRAQLQYCTSFFDQQPCVMPETFYSHQVRIACNASGFILHALVDVKQSKENIRII